MPEYKCQARTLTDSEISSWLLVLCFAAVYLLWGSTFLAIRWAVSGIPPFMMIGLRCASGGIILFAWLAWKGTATRQTRGELCTAAIAGILMFVGCHGLLAWAEQRVPSGTASLYLAAEPAWLVTLSSVWVGRAPTQRVMGGLALGLVGVAVLSSNGDIAHFGGPLEALALVGSGLAWALGSLVALHGSASAPVVQVVALQLAAGAAALLPLSAALGEWSAWTPVQVSARAWAALAFLVLGGTVLAFAAYMKLLRVASPAAAGSYAFVNPLVALGLAWAAGDQAVTIRTLVAATFILLAVALTVERRAAGGRGKGASIKTTRWQSEVNQGEPR